MSYKLQYSFFNRATCFGYFLAIYRPNKKPEFRYINCVPNGIPLRLQNTPKLWFLIGPEDG